MATVLPFRGLRYSTSNPLDLSLITAPPYDCIDDEMQGNLYDAHPHNIVRLIFGQTSPDDTPQNNRYTRAAELVKKWQDQNVLAREKHSALYLYEQEFTVAGRTRVRRGFVCRVALEEFGSGSIFPHEKTFPKHVEDRLELLKATSVNMSQVCALYPDERNEVIAVLDRLPLARPDLHVVDPNGVVNRMWVVTNEAAAAEVTALMQRRPLFIADGHHRYTTALAYRRWLIEQGQQVTGHHPANYTSMMCISMSDSGLEILPTHRVLVDLPPVNAEQLQKILEPYFTWERFTGAEATSGRMHAHLVETPQTDFGFYLRDDQDAYLATLKTEGIMNKLAPEQSDHWRELDVAVLHRLVFDRLLSDAFGGLENVTIRYLHDDGEAFDAVHEQGASMAILVKAPTMEQVRAIAAGGEVMPQKSTYFYPKLLSGLVMNPLD